RKEAHDGDDERQRAAGDGAGRNDRSGRLVAIAAPRARAGTLACMEFCRTGAPAAGCEAARVLLERLVLRVRVQRTQRRRSCGPIIRSGHGRRATPAAALWSAASADGRAWR